MKQKKLLFLSTVFAIFPIAAQAQVSIKSPVDNSVLPSTVKVTGSCTGSTKVNVRNGTKSLDAACSSSAWSISVSKSALTVEDNGTILVKAVQGNYSNSKTYLAEEAAPAPTPPTPTPDPVTPAPGNPAPIGISCTGDSLGLPKNQTQYLNVKYGADKLNAFDLYLPDTTGTYPVVILIHGGAFVKGDKADYKTTALDYAKSGVAAITLNYRFAAPPKLASDKEANQNEGALKSIKDGQRALQFIRCYSKELRINPSKVVLFGSSAGASMSLWIGLQDNLAIADSADPVARISTRVSGIFAKSTQSSLDAVFWEEQVFSKYPGFTTDVLSPNAPGLYFLKAYNRTKYFSDPAIVAYRKAVHFIDFMSADDPELYISSSEPDVDPSDTSSQYYKGLHHPAHVMALFQRGDQVGVKGTYSTPGAPQYKLAAKETGKNFVLRKLKE